MDLFRPFAAGLLRHVLTAVAGALVSKGVLQSSQVESFIGAAFLFAGILWCWGQKVLMPEIIAKLNEHSHDKVLKAKEAHVERTFGGFPTSTGAMIAVCVCVGVLVAGASATSYAQQQKRPLLTRVQQAVSQPQQSIMERLRTASLEDLQYAKALADAANTPQSQARSKCWAAWIRILAPQTSAEAAEMALPKARLFTNFERISQVAENLQPMSEFHIACAPVAQGMRLNIGQFVLTILGGGVSLATLVPAL